MQGQAHFYYVRRIDERVQDALDVYAVWVFGATGVGKTCLLKHYLNQGGQKPIELSLSHLSGNLQKEALLKEIADTCMQIGNLSEPLPPTISGIVNFLVERHKLTSIILYIDEVPISQQRVKESECFVQLMSELILGLKQRIGAGANIVISSIERPTFNGNEKLKEQLLFFEIESWSNEELQGLYTKIISIVDTLAVKGDFLGVLLECCGGSPRFLKTFLRNRFLADKEKSDLDVLEQTKGQFDWRKP